MHRLPNSDMCHVGKVKGECLGKSQPRRPSPRREPNKENSGGKDKDGGSANAMGKVEMRVWETKGAADKGGQTENGPRDAWETSNIDRVSSTKRRTGEENNEPRIEAS